MRNLTALLLIVLVGCAPRSSGPQPRSGLPAGIASSKVDPIRLHNQLILFADDSAGDIAGTMSNIAADSRDRVIWEQTLLFKTRVIPLIYMSVRQDDPREAFLDTWVLVARMRQYLTTGEGSTRFGTQQAESIAMAKGIEDRLLALGERSYPKEVVDDLKDEVEDIAGRNPINEVAGITAVHAADAAAPMEKGALQSILAIPLLPVTGMSDIKSASGSIDSATRAFESFTEVTQLMPEQVRWQAELLLLEFDSLETVVAVRKDLGHISASAESLSKTAATLPQDVRREMDLALKDAEATIGKVQTALADARQVSEGAARTADGLAQAAAEWDKTAKTVNQVLLTYKEIQGPPDPNAASQPSAMEELATAAEKTSAAAEQLRGLLDDLKKLDTALSQAGTAADDSIDHAVARLDGLVDRMTWRALMVVGAFAVAMVLYRIIVNLIAGSRGAGRNPAR